MACENPVLRLGRQPLAVLTQKYHRLVYLPGKLKKSLNTSRGYSATLNTPVRFSPAFLRKLLGLVFNVAD